MKQTVLKRGTSLFLAFLMCLTTFLGIGTTQVFAAGTKGEALLIAYPREGDVNYSQTAWGRDDMTLMNGWSMMKSKYFSIFTMNSYSGNICYCIEPGTLLENGDMFEQKDETFFDNYPRAYNHTITPYEIQHFLGRILHYGYTGAVSTEWRTQNSEDANTLAHIIATQILVWETVVGERDSNFNHVSTGGYSAVYDMVRNDHPLRSLIDSYYHSMVSSIQKHTTLPSFFARSGAKAQTVELEWNGSEYTAALTDTNGVLSNYTYSSSNSNVKFTVSGNRLIITSSTAPTSTVSITATKKNSYRRGILIWSDGNYAPGVGDQDTITYGQEIDDPVKGFLNIKVSYGSAKIVKTSEDGKVDGISFRVQGNGIDKTVQTQNGGQIQIDNLMPGIYTVTEQTENKYVPQESRSVTVVSGQTATVTFNNKLKRGNLTVTKTAEDGLEEGAKLHLSGTAFCGLKVDEYAIVGSDKKAYFKDVLIGTGYVLEEIDTPYRYEVPENQTADIEWNKVTTKSFENTLKRGDLTVTKTAEDSLELGMRFHLYGTAYCGMPVDEYSTVGADGKAYFKDVLIGTNYILEEVDTPIRYVVPEKQTAAIEWNKVTQKSFDNPLKKWNLTVTKYDSESSAAQGDASLCGAKYGIYKGDQLVDTYTTDRGGQFTTKFYICDSDWSLREIIPSEGYLLDPTVYHIGAEAKLYTVEYNSTALDVLETVQKGRIAVIKHCDDGETQIETPEAGAEFEVYLKSSGSYEAAKESERDILVCDENGFAQSKDLPYGIYTVRQTKGWEGKELLPPFDVFVKEDGETYRYLINNATFEALIEIVKKDIETGNVIPASGIGFKVRNTDTGKYVVQHINYPTPVDIDIYYTDSTGKLMLPEALPYGNYEIIEQNTCYGYVLDANPVPFTVDGNKTVVTVEKHNIAQKGTITVSKSGEVFSSVTAVGGGYVDEDGNDVAFPNLYQPVYSVQGLAGAVYEITAAEDIYTLDGTLRYTKGDVVAEITTGADGTATTDPLYLGKFEVREIKAPYGMVISDEVHSVELTYAGQEISITETATAFYNERQTASVSLSKVLAQNERFQIGMNGEILSVQFGLFAAENLTAADGSVIPVDSLLEIVNCDENGNAIFKTDIPVGAKLYVKELAVDSNYILSDEKYHVAFVYAGQEIANVEIRANNGEAIENDLIYGTIKGLKIDRETEETVTGALFGLFRADTGEFTEETAVLTAKSQEDGIFMFQNIPYGNWLIKELQPAESFLPNEEIYPVTVSAHEQLIEITVVNDRIPEIGTTATTEEEKQTHPNESITIEDEVEYKHLIPGKEYTLKGVLINKATGEPFLVNGTEVRSEVIFVPTEPSGTVIVTFTFDGNGIMENTDIVVFESLYKDGLKLTVHADIEDDGQTVTVLVTEIGTTATIDGEKEICATEVFTLTDIVSYKNLIPGKEYVLKGVLMDKVTGKALVIDSQEIHAETTFTPEAPTGEAVVEFTFDSKYIKADTDIVVFESLFRGGRELAVHADIEDEGQTVKVKVPEIGTQATTEGKKEITAKGSITIDDTVSYRNLTPGKEYTVKGVLMNKKTGEPFKVDGKESTAELTFTPEKSDGEIKVSFTFDAAGIATETEVVVFESLYRDGVEVAVHADIEDDGQTVKLTPPAPDVPQTGDESNLGFWIGLGAVALGGLAAVGIIYIRKKKDDDDE